MAKFNLTLANTKKNSNKETCLIWQRAPSPKLSATWTLLALAHLLAKSKKWYTNCTVMCSRQCLRAKHLSMLSQIKTALMTTSTTNYKTLMLRPKLLKRQEACVVESTMLKKSWKAKTMLHVKNLSNWWIIFAKNALLTDVTYTWTSRKRLLLANNINLQLLLITSLKVVVFMPKLPNQVLLFVFQARQVLDLANKNLWLLKETQQNLVTVFSPLSMVKRHWTKIQSWMVKWLYPDYFQLLRRYLASFF